MKTYDFENMTRCTNAEPGTYGHECGKPATWIGTFRGSARPGFDSYRAPSCDRCKADGYEMRHAIRWERVTP